ncbi:MAG: recombination protein RecR [Planctomycetia bacterium]|uniref:Recombination protein RecR n=1 Tax=Candidatus Brocadia sapporoensis TaxID=392547 RepID=A0A1V6M326_9BACT|nr:recombination mediator RecR [Candidatus Brocadia sapporoensis]MCC7238701.1 recombination protein RecR [Candidatus Brocadia sp.]OQZ04472.1 MAG: recombination protein RecR [Candidatus Brocadia sp. UTAMX1]QOJ07800.1 MAG: recombination protein RecR [Planctomycetia bacterium]RZV57063.1 MAG: recombination protein RecR [Candidatus Brocadia sp. BROELEC01]TVL98317.1 MAG: recombination protein RecR [Candidatus Brocadia sp. BL1]TWU53450.1 Recombination protein RecR [Candidatus Brocadiaceae bacterium 
MNAYPQSVIKLISEFGKMPGIGQKTAERLACYILKQTTEEAMQLACAIRDVKKLVKTCSTCFNVSENDPCHICSDLSRDRSTICVVEQLADFLTIEKTGKYRGLYHVLQGHISPLEGIHPESLTIEKLLHRVNAGHIKEVLLATNLNMEGDATALYIHKHLSPSGVRVTRLARGLPTGSYLEYANTAIVADAINGRNEMAEV